MIDDSWAKATRVALTYDFTNRRAADEPTALIEKSQRHLKLAKQSGRNQAA